MKNTIVKEHLQPLRNEYTTKNSIILDTIRTYEKLLKNNHQQYEENLLKIKQIDDIMKGIDNNESN